MPAWRENPSDSICHVPTSHWRRNLTFAWVARGSGTGASNLYTQDLVARTPINPATSTGSWEMTQYGCAFRGDGSAEKLRFPTLAKNAWAFNGTDYFSVFLCMKILSTATAGSHMLTHQWGSGTGAWTFNWSTGTTFRHFWHDGTTARNLTWTSGMPAVNTFATFLLTRKLGGVYELYTNGVSQGTQTGNFGYGAGNYDLVVGNETGANNCTHGDYYSVYVWKNRALEDRDAWALAADPWALVRPSLGWGFLTSAAAAGVTHPVFAQDHIHDAIFGGRVLV